MQIPGRGHEFACFDEAPIDSLNERKFPVYIVDYEWNYLFANTVAKNNVPGVTIEGKNIKEVWKELPALNFEPIYYQLKDFVNNREPVTLRTTSPVTNKAIEIAGKPLSDCYYFSITELPDKELLISELRSLIRKGSQG